MPPFVRVMYVQLHSDARILPLAEYDAGLLEGLYRSRTHPRANDLCSHWRCRS